MKLKIEGDKVYCPDHLLERLEISRPVQDIYIYTGYFIPGIGEKFKEEGYDPDNPDTVAIGRIKKKHKTLRQICKVVVLSSQYGAGPKKIQQTLALSGIKKSFEEVREIHAAYWNLYSGIKEYQKFLEGQWARNGGWVLNGIGRPVCVHEDYLKDIVNRVVQSTGHDVLIHSIPLLREELEARGVNFDWVIADFHDQTTIEVDEQDAPLAVEAIKAMYKRLNEYLKPYVPIRGEPEIGHSLADFKCED